MPYSVQHLHSTGLNSSLIGLELSSTRVNRDSRHGWLEMVGRVTPHQAVVCTSFIVIREFNNSYVRKVLLFYLFSELLSFIVEKHLKKLLSERSKGNKTPCVYRCHMGSWKGVRGTCKPLLAGLRWEVGSCVKEQSNACQSVAVLLPQLNFEITGTRKVKYPVLLLEIPLLLSLFPVVMHRISS